MYNIYDTIRNKRFEELAEAFSHILLFFNFSKVVKSMYLYIFLE